tara:strand:- start:73 stop:273 length:201 start_codon:yes stop_codon:yes gene_type:complete
MRVPKVRQNRLILKKYEEKKTQSDVYVVVCMSGIRACGVMAAYCYIILRLEKGKVWKQEERGIRYW